MKTIYIYFSHDFPQKSEYAYFIGLDFFSRITLHFEKNHDIKLLLTNIKINHYL